DKDQLEFFWVTPKSETLLSKLSEKQRAIFDLGGVARIQWSVYDTLYLRQGVDASAMMISSSKDGFQRSMGSKESQRFLKMKPEFVPYLKHVFKGDSLAWIQDNVEGLSLSEGLDDFQLIVHPKKTGAFHPTFLKMNDSQRELFSTKDDFNFQVYLSMFSDLLSKQSLSQMRFKGSAFLLKVLHLFEGNYSLRAELFGNLPKFELISEFKTLGSSARFISELESYVQSKSLDLSKLSANKYSLTIPFSPMQFFLNRDRKNISLSNGLLDLEERSKLKEKGLLSLSLRTKNKDLLIAQIDRVIHAYHKKKTLNCFENLSKRDALFKYCPLGGNYSVKGQGVVCHIHGDEQSSKFLSLVHLDGRKLLLKNFVNQVKRVHLSIKTSPTEFKFGFRFLKN
ncbi:hypothetical protein MJH12_14685, partial [bacterium]|nr:hypothetical protein [bacterium]